MIGTANALKKEQVISRIHHQLCSFKASTSKMFMQDLFDWSEETYFTTTETNFYLLKRDCRVKEFNNTNSLKGKWYMSLILILGSIWLDNF